MTRLEIDWPDAGDERVRAAQGRLANAGATWRRVPFADRLSRVAEVLAAWTAPDSPWRRELAAGLASESRFAEATIREGLDSALRAWRPADFTACAHREIGAQLAERALAPFEWTLVVAGGAIPMPTLLTPLVPLVLGSPVLLRGTRQDGVTPELLARSLAERDVDLGRALEPIRFPVEDGAAYQAALEAPCVVATGADATLREMRTHVSDRQRFVGYGHRFSIGVVGPGIAEPELLRATARGFALDVARWDQSGCLSPVLVFLVGVAREHGERLAEAIADALRDLDTEMPLGETEPDRAIAISNERASARMRAGGDGARLIVGDGYTVVLEADATPRPAPLGRFLRLMPVGGPDALDEALRPFHGHLSSAAVAGFDGDHSATESYSARRDPSDTVADGVGGILARAGVSRSTVPGALQTPRVDWPHDGWPLFAPMARFTSPEGPLRR